jgi:hypothetical protein
MKTLSILANYATSLETLRVCYGRKDKCMAYDTNPRLPRLRARACEMVKQGKSVIEVAMGIIQVYMSDL